MKIKEVIENVVSVGLVSLIGNSLPVGLNPESIKDFSEYKPAPIEREAQRDEIYPIGLVQTTVPVVRAPIYQDAVLPKKSG